MKFTSPIRVRNLLPNKVPLIPEATFWMIYLLSLSHRQFKQNWEKFPEKRIEIMMGLNILHFSSLSHTYVKHFTAYKSLNRSQEILGDNVVQNCIYLDLLIEVTRKKHLWFNNITITYLCYFFLSYKVYFIVFHLFFFIVMVF